MGAAAEGGGRVGGCGRSARGCPEPVRERLPAGGGGGGTQWFGRLSCQHGPSQIDPRTDWNNNE